MKKYLGFALVLALVVMPVVAQQPAAEVFTGAPEATVPAVPGIVWELPEGVTVLVDNGPLITSAGTGIGGADESVLQSVSLSMNTLGFTVSQPTFRLADDFTLASDARVDDCTFFAYQTGAGPGPSTITAGTLRVWDGPPAAVGSNIVFGDTVTDRFISSSFSNILRVTETTTGTTNNRSIMATSLDLGGLDLTAGTYWLDWSLTGSVAFSGPFGPPITIVGQTTTGDGSQSGDAGATYAPILDGITGTAQGLPFVCTGAFPSGDLPVPTLDWRGLAILLLALSAAAVFMMRRRRSV